jgi:hypothetical protein
VRVLLLTVQTAVVVDANTTGRFEVAVATSAAGALPKVCPVRGANEMVCVNRGATEIDTERSTVAAAA